MRNFFKAILLLALGGTAANADDVKVKRSDVYIGPGNSYEIYEFSPSNRDDVVCIAYKPAFSGTAEPKLICVGLPPKASK